MSLYDYSGVGEYQGVFKGSVVCILRLNPLVQWSFDT